MKLAEEIYPEAVSECEGAGLCLLGGGWRTRRPPIFGGAQPRPSVRGFYSVVTWRTRQSLLRLVALEGFMELRRE